MRISGKREEQTVWKIAVEGISPGGKTNFQNSGKLGQYECDKIHFTTVCH
jgi:hypothetical protein